MGRSYHENIHVIEHPVDKEGIVDEDDQFIIEARFLEHGVHNIGWRIKEKDKRKFDKQKLKELKIEGMQMRQLIGGRLP